MLPANFSVVSAAGRSALGSLLRPRLRPLWALALVAALLPLDAAATGRDDRRALQRFAGSGTITSRTVQEDLARASWSGAELRAALVRAYGLSTTGVDQFLSSAAGTALLQRAVPWWSPELGPQVRLAALKAAIVADSQDGSISLLGVLNALPVRFSLTEASGVGAGVGPGCACPQECGRSALAQLAFLIACVQAGATATR